MKGQASIPHTCVPMLRRSQIVLLGWLVSGPCGAQELVAVYRLDTADYRIEVNVRFFPPYLGRRLTFSSSANPGKELCCSGNGDSSSCIERFVGALAAVTYRFQPRRKNVPAATAFREVVKVLSQSEGLDERPPYIREQRLVQGVGSDIQAFGYDESPVAEPERAALRAESRARMWRIYRQELFLSGDSEPFGVVDWKHTLNRIDVVRSTGRGPETVTQRGAVRASLNLRGTCANSKHFQPVSPPYQAILNEREGYEAASFDNIRETRSNL
jgi:hypothetical protein